MANLGILTNLQQYATILICKLFQISNNSFYPFFRSFYQRIVLALEFFNDISSDYLKKNRKWCLLFMQASWSVSFNINSFLRFA